VRVIDSSALVKYYVREPGWERVKKITLDGVATLSFAVIEIVNALWKKVLRNEMSPNIAKEIVEDLAIRKALPLEPYEPYTTEAFRIAVEHRITVYDALFIAFVLKKGLELATANTKQAEVAGKLGVRAVLV